jgi:hypothetical protein
MPPRFATEPRANPRDHRLLALLLVLPLLVSLAAVWALDHEKAQKSLFTTSNMVGAAKSLLEGDGLTACTEDMGTPGDPICFRSARMPINALVVALGIRLLGDRYLPVALFKTVLLLLPLELAIYLVWLPGCGGSPPILWPQQRGFSMQPSWMATSGAVCNCPLRPLPLQ